MGISGSKSKLRKGGRPEGWYHVSDAEWAEYESQSNGETYVVFRFQGEQPDGESKDIMLFLGADTSKTEDYVKVEDGALISVDDENEFQIAENSSVGRFFASLSDAGVSDKVMDNIGDKPGGINGLWLHIVQEPVLGSDGEPKRDKNDREILNTVVKEISKTEPKGGKGKPAGKTSSKEKVKEKATSGKKRRVVEDDEDEEEEEEAEEEEEEEPEEEEEEESDDEEEEEEEEEKPKRRPLKAAAKAGKAAPKGKVAGRR
jgi:hypothetical protein